MHLKIMKELTTAEFQEKIANNRSLMVIEFWNGESGNCAIMEPIYSKLAETYKGKFDFFRIHVNHDFDRRNTFNISRLPSYTIYKRNHLMEIIQGVVSYTKFSQSLSAYI